MSRAAGAASPHRYRLHRAGVLNVWQYDDQVFSFADGRLLLRGSNGAGKSKTLEMLLPFVIDGDKARMTASARHHTSLLWLMLDGVDAATRTGYLWVEFARDTESGVREILTCAVGIRASKSAKTAGSWFFTVPVPIGDGMALEDAAGPLTKEHCREAVTAAGGQLFDSPRAYKEHVGRVLFGLDPSRYDDLLRLLYWLRQPQVGEDIEPARLTEILSVALPEVDQSALRSVGETFDQLSEHGEQLARRERAARAVDAVAQTYARYARRVARTRGATVVEAAAEERRRARDVTDKERHLAESVALVKAAGEATEHAVQRVREAVVRLQMLESSPAAEGQKLLAEKLRRLGELGHAASQAQERARGEQQRALASSEQAQLESARIGEDITSAATVTERLIADSGAVHVPLVLATLGALGPPSVGAPHEAHALTAALTAAVERARAGEPVVGRVIAALAMVEEALTAAQHADSAKGHAESQLAEAEQREERAAVREAEATAEAQIAETRFGELLSTWRADERGIVIDVPDVTTSSVARFGSTVRALLTPEREERAALEREFAVTARLLREEENRLRRRRLLVEAESDPAPPAPEPPRTERNVALGLPLWRLVDFAEAVPEATRGDLEAALHASGLLDALVLRDGSLLAPGSLDTVLPIGGAVMGTDLRSVLLAACPPGSVVTPGVVDAVLSRVALGGDERDGTARIGLDGSWQLGPLTGRAAKPRPQYVGAGARADERLRRLAELDTSLAELAEQLAAAQEASSAAANRSRDFAAWVDALPGTTELTRAWVTLDERATAVGRARDAVLTAGARAETARAVAARRHDELRDLAAAHSAPTQPEALRARRDRVRDVQSALGRLSDRLMSLGARPEPWRALAERALADGQSAAAAELASRTALSSAAEAQSELDALRERLGASVLELEHALAETRRARSLARRSEEEARTAAAAGATRLGRAEQAAEDARRRRDEHAPELALAVAELAAMTGVPGLVRSATGVVDVGTQQAWALAAGQVEGDAISAPVLALARGLVAIPPDDRPSDDNALLEAHRSLTAGPGADVEPRIVDVAGVLTVLARDELGEAPLAELAPRLAARVDADRALLTARERKLFEEHLLGDLGEALRTRRIEAQELVAAMNTLLKGVTTSQGIAVKLDWSLRDDVSDDVRAVTSLLARPLGALLADERESLRNALHRLIESERAEDSALGYAEHLERALDYRRWSSFAVRITRPETPGSWEKLTRRTALSQGEQKVVCYLPLFAAAAAHFSSVAGAAPHAPRLVLLDDAFPKIDVRTHPLLFGLLVQLDLDFVITSERLWGDHASVPSLAIYEALRSPNERGIAQYRHVWDGVRLAALGT